MTKRQRGLSDRLELNPIVEKDARVFVRTWRSPAAITLYLAILFSVVLISITTTTYYYGFYYSYSSVFTPADATNIFLTMSVVQLYIIMFMVPAITGASITSERERQTIELLLCTKITTRQIAVGKLASSVLYVLLIAFSSLPIVAFVFLYGGINFGQLLLIYLYYVFAACVMGSIGIFWSSIFKRTVAAIIMTYLTVGFFVLVMPMLCFGAAELIKSAYESYYYIRNMTPPAMAFNVEALFHRFGCIDISTGFGNIISKMVSINGAAAMGFSDSVNIFPGATGGIGAFINEIPDWVSSLILGSLIIWGCLAGATKKLMPVSKKWFEFSAVQPMAGAIPAAPVNQAGSAGREAEPPANQ